MPCVDTIGFKKTVALYSGITDTVWHAQPRQEQICIEDGIVRF